MGEHIDQQLVLRLTGRREEGLQLAHQLVFARLVLRLRQRPGLGEQGLNLLGTGNSLQDQNFQQQMNLQQMPGNFDWQNLGKYASIIQPGAGIGGTSSSTQNQPTYNNPLAGALGGAVGAAGLQSAMPSLFQGAVGAMGPQIPGALSAFGGPAGMALGAVTNVTPSWWQLAAWSILAVVFVVFAARTTLAGRRNGWDTPIEEIKQP